ncbi:high affinity immunoglobulin epsilon receptor subunit gamma isoform X1 [Struthio camelus]|uniref:high affinity immunoglobulin epsilon receptor subunit gamma isoform X1 n=1 Tax=Struthio camelus TaxID=8801 RepID=UPI00051E40E7|nr:PREDICTED: high affinity immunoglobulin epsilon receptor subunit gamma [Struthio camelus australis]
MSACLVLALALLLQVQAAEALMEPELCYILDAILFIYGIVLTVLYCRLKIQVQRASKDVSRAGGEQKGEAIYTGLSMESQEMYETLQPKSS